jgi:putative ABC transport system substrate-binding protein
METLMLVRAAKKFLPALLFTVVLLPAFSTGKREAANNSFKIGIIQLAENGAFTDMRTGFLSRMEELGYDQSRLDVTYKNALGDVGALNSICQEMAGANYDLVVTIATPATQAFVNMGSTVPVFFISVTDPVASGVLSSMEKPDKLATGTSNLVPVDQIFLLAKELTPNVKRYGILYNSGESNAVTTVQKAKAYLAANGYTVQESTVTNSSEVDQAAQALVSRVDALYVPIDSMVQSAMPQLAQIAREAKKPVYGSSPVMVVSGALATVSVSDKLIGAMSADMADRYFKGTPISQIPAVTLGTFMTVINRGTLNALGIALPESLSSAILIGN